MDQEIFIVTRDYWNADYQIVAILESQEAAEEYVKEAMGWWDRERDDFSIQLHRVGEMVEPV